MSAVALRFAIIEMRVVRVQHVNIQLSLSISPIDPLLVKFARLIYLEIIYN